MFYSKKKKKNHLITFMFQSAKYFSIKWFLPFNCERSFLNISLKSPVEYIIRKNKIFTSVRQCLFGPL